MKNIKRILVTGFPHSGTTILKSKIGECKNVFEQIDESELPQPHRFDDYLNSDKEFYLWKDPIVRHDLFRFGFSRKPLTPYKDDVIICILRNPYYVFTSQIKRGLDPFSTQFHTYLDYIRTAEIFLDAVDNKYPNVYCIRYEDMFENDFENLKIIMDDIGLVYSDDLFKTRTKIYNINEKYELLDYQPEHGTAEYRIWQINKDFENFNQKTKIEIPEKLENLLRIEMDRLSKLGY